MNKMQKKIFIAATLLGLLGVVLGAFAAHGLRSVLTDSALESFQTGVRYQMYHAFFLFFIGLNSHLSALQKKYIFSLTLAGIFLFSVSIYLLATNALTSIDFTFLGPITPIGGLFLISAWGALLYGLIKHKN
tara:strand:+ start:266 stop:661 length:396 start_codon:yes stop_codon:yes gene_type:complete